MKTTATRGALVRRLPDSKTCRTQPLPKMKDLALCLVESPMGCPCAFLFVGQYYCQCFKAAELSRTPDLQQVSLPFEEFLKAVRLRDLADGFVAPDNDVRERIATEIAERTGIKSRSAIHGNRMQTAQERIGAHPNEFVAHTLFAVQDICAILARNAAEIFQIAFVDNSPAMERAGTITLVVRYSK